jgi:iron complex outermembrane receptor protein
MRRGILIVAAMAAAARAGAQGRDSLAARDTARGLAAVRVQVARGDERLGRLPWAIGVQSTQQIRQAQPTLGIDEALANIPGVVVFNRYNYALDQKLSIRGAGARANFGIRGVKVLLDGVPQSLPDGQSQLTNLELGAVEKVEVLRGSASSLYGNGSGGVIAFTQDLRSPDRLNQMARLTVGSFGLSKWQTRTGGRAGRALGMLSASRTTLDGFRQHNGADTRQVNGAVDVAVRPALTVQLRGNVAHVPFAQNPGALTAAEYAANRDSAAAVNVRRGASREVGQRQGSVSLVHAGTRLDLRATVFGLSRTVDNALATPPPAPAGPANGIYATLYRRFLGGRVDVGWRFGEGEDAPRLAVGIDAQRSSDDRRNRRSTGGRPVAAVDTLLLDQQEIVASVGPFAQVTFAPHRRVLASLGGRYDRLTFTVRDNFLRDGRDNSGARTLAAATGHLGVTWRAADGFAPYANVASAFETPTTTELQVRPDGQGGFNPDLDPQRIVTVEAGARGRLGARVGYDIAVFRQEARDAIVQFLALDGRSFFRNAGRTDYVGVELGVDAQVTRWLTAQLAWNGADYAFGEYRVQRGAATDTLDGNAVAGVPRSFLRAGLRARLAGATLDVDHTASGRMWADDANALAVDGWGAGQLNVRVARAFAAGGWRVEPFAGINNALDEAYVGAVTVNGAGARVLEPAPRRNWFVGAEVTARVVR